jgi:hypothetical protein
LNRTHRQEQWKLPLPQFIEEIYYKRFKRSAPLPKAAHSVSKPPVPKEHEAEDQQPAQGRDS